MQIWVKTGIFLLRCAWLPVMQQQELTGVTSHSPLQTAVMTTHPYNSLTDHSHDHIRDHERYSEKQETHLVNTN